jgi:hypothetical protein
MPEATVTTDWRCIHTLLPPTDRFLLTFSFVQNATRRTGLEVPCGACEQYTSARASQSALILLEDDCSSTVAFFVNFKLFACVGLRQAGIWPVVFEESRS